MENFLVPQTVEKWKIVFYISAGIYLFGCLVYWFFASGEVQPWARVHEQQTIEDNRTDIEKYNKPPPYAYTNEGIELKDEQRFRNFNEFNYFKDSQRNNNNIKYNNDNDDYIKMYFNIHKCD